MARTGRWWSERPRMVRQRHRQWAAQGSCPTAIGRLMRRVRVDENGCWIYTGTIDSKGYGYMHCDGRKQRTHRLTYAWTHGPIPGGLELDHGCRVKACCNPDHVEPVTHAINMARSGPFQERSHCGRGHAMEGYNVYRYGPDRRRRGCRTCMGINTRAYQRRQREQAVAA